MSDFLSATQFPFCDAHDKATLRKLGRKKGEPFGYSGFQTWISRKDWNDLPGQVTDAIRFLRRHKGDLKKLRSEFKASDIRLDFPYFLRIGKNNVAVQSDFLPPTLIALAAEQGIGIEMTLYPSASSSKKLKTVWVE